MTRAIQLFGQVDIDAKTSPVAVALKDIAGASRYSKKLARQRA